MEVLLVLALTIATLVLVDVTYGTGILITAIQAGTRYLCLARAMPAPTLKKRPPSVGFFISLNDEPGSGENRTRCSLPSGTATCGHPRLLAART